MPKVRCSTCDTYIERDEAVRNGVQSFCDDICRRDKAQEYQGLRTALKPSRMKKKRPKNPMPTGLRDAVIASDGGRCRSCRVSDALHVHHVMYRSQGGKHVASNLITLCHKCHDMVHSDKGKWQRACLALVAMREEFGDKSSRLSKFVEE